MQLVSRSTKGCFNNDNAAHKRVWTLLAADLTYLGTDKNVHDQYKVNDQKSSDISNIR
jgi:hypothetical protein